MKQIDGRHLIALSTTGTRSGSGSGSGTTSGTGTGLGLEAGAPMPLLLDVREPWEFALAAIRIEGLDTVPMPMNTVPQRLGELDPSRPVVCICHHGVRSAQVVAFLERQGFESVYNLAGGIDAWSLQIDVAVPRY